MGGKECLRFEDWDPDPGGSGMLSGVLLFDEGVG